MDVRAWRVDDFGIPPYWSGLITSITAGPTRKPTTKSSATLSSAGVREMGRRCLLISSTGFTFGIGTTSAIFHASRSLFMAKLQLMIVEKGYAKISAYSYKSQLGISSGPATLRGFYFSSADKIADSGIIKGVDSSSEVGTNSNLWIEMTPEARQMRHWSHLRCLVQRGRQCLQHASWK